MARTAHDAGLADPGLIQSMILFKQPRIGGEVSMHQDATFLHTRPQSCIGFWFALEDATVENGCLFGLPGLAGRRLAERFRYADGPGDGELGMEHLADEAMPMEDAVPLEVRAGGAGPAARPVPARLAPQHVRALAAGLCRPHDRPAGPLVARQLAAPRGAGARLRGGRDAGRARDARGGMSKAPYPILPVPKAELHCHIEGAARPELVRSLARRHGIDLAHVFDADGLYRSGDFTTFLETYDEVVRVFREPEDYQALARDHYSWLAEQGAIYGEIFVSPSHAEKLGFGWPALVEALALGMREARDLHGVEGRIIATGVRHFGPARRGGGGRDRRAAPRTRWSPASAWPATSGSTTRPSSSAPSPSRARPASASPPHAGEHMGPESVTHALDQLGVTRIGHGVRAMEDPALVDRIVAERIVLEICPGSNVALGVYETLSDHPFGRFWDAGARVTLNADDPPFFHTSLADEYAFGRDVALLEEDELREVTRIALEAAFVDEETRAALLARV